ncbi:hypothetical protein [Aureimonas glaciei]|uniref:Uncharacterized protein n=1 Tax=Aureimonas glaciei TaxID=1776957 RepID=A0A916Y5N9_9HYPH|nr:hypothetical protein [Aureimonas glaciei]GGD31555.1 hypothetical protein GCM10011335_38250 [Aureimonas glaciei]
MLVHRAYTDSLRITPEDSHWVFDQVVFFINADFEEDIDAIEASYTQGDADHVYVLDMDHSHIDVFALVADATAIAEVQAIWGKDIDPQSIIDGSLLDADEEVEDACWHQQRLRAQLAGRMGFHAVRDRDEQGEVFAVDFSGRNDELNGAWRYLGRYSDHFE